MVFSNIDSTIEYEEIRNIDKHDVDEEIPTYVYRGRIFNQDIKFVLGKPKFDYVEQNIIHFNIYLVKDKSIIGRMGIYEVKNNVYTNLLDDEGNVIVEKLDEPLIFDFTRGIIRDNFDDSYIVDPKKVNDEFYPNNFASDDSDDSSLTSDDDSDLDIKDDDEYILNKDKQATLMDSQEDIEFQKIKQQLAEANAMLEKKNGKVQTKEEAYQEMAIYKHNKEDLWINKFLRSNKYFIVDNEGGGDCLFAVLRDALLSLNSDDYKTISVKEIRNKLAHEIKQEQFLHYKELYEMIVTGIVNHKEKIKKGKSKHNEFKSLIGGTNNPSDKAKLIQSASSNVKTITNSNEILKKYVAIGNDFEFMKDVKTLDDLKEVIRTVGGNYWADSWAISTLERLYNVKFIILAKDYFDEATVKSLKLKHPLEYLENNNVLQCGDYDSVIQERVKDGGVFEPKYYILTDYSSSIHYKLITYDKNVRNEKFIGNGAFKFSQLPYIIKELVLKKCMQKDSGAYAIIPDFRHFALENDVEIEILHEQKEAINKSATSKLDKDCIENPNSLYLDNEKCKLIIQISKNAADKKIANGKFDNEVSGEFYSTKAIEKYEALLKELLTMKNWRQKLMDTYIDDKMKIVIDGLRWASVQHYVYASRFINVSEIYQKFSYESEHVAGKSLDEAKKLYETLLKDKTLTKLIKTSDGSYSKKKKSYLKTALRAKFSDINDGENNKLKTILRLTYPAKINIFISGNTPKKEATELMEIRKEIIDIEKSKK